MGLQSPLTLEHFRQAPDHHIEEAADQQADHRGDDDEGQRIERSEFRSRACQIAAPSWKMGRYIATTRPPTTTPSTTMMNGSIRLVRLSTMLSTSSS